MQQEGDVIMTVPIKTIRSLSTVSKTISSKLPQDASIHGLLAADLLFNPPKATHWGKLVPKLADFQEQVPYFWSKSLQELLPVEAKTLLAKQQATFRRDWEQFKIGFPDTNMQDYLYAWFLVSTRAFYYETPQTLLYPWHDRLALLPVADLFNHAATGCSVSYSLSGSYTITADREYLEGEEVCTSYGHHSNDFLLAEYGFVLPDNSADLVSLDDVILPKLSGEQKASLNEKGELGNFMLSADSKPCDRTKAALHQLLNGAATKSDGGLDSQNTPSGTDALLSSLLAELLNRIKSTRKAIFTSDAGTASQRAVLVQRWDQIEAILKQSIEVLDRS